MVSPLEESEDGNRASFPRWGKRSVIYNHFTVLNSYHEDGNNFGLTLRLTFIRGGIIMNFTVTKGEDHVRRYY